MYGNDKSQQGSVATWFRRVRSFTDIIIVTNLLLSLSWGNFKNGGYIWRSYRLSTVKLTASNAMFSPGTVLLCWKMKAVKVKVGFFYSATYILVTYRNKVPPLGVEPRHVTHPGTNWARRRVTLLIRPTPLPVRHAATRRTCLRSNVWRAVTVIGTSHYDNSPQ